MRYVKTYKGQTDPQRLAEMLAMQEANQKLTSDYAPIPAMNNAPNFIDPQDLMKMRQMATNRQARKIGRNTYDTVTPINTQGLA